jgi:ribosome biogenesis GTPase
MIHSTSDEADVAVVSQAERLLGRICRKDLGLYQVDDGEQVVSCTISSRLRKELDYPTADLNSRRRRVQSVKVRSHSDPLAIGDLVRWVDSGDGRGMIVDLRPRRNCLSRKAAKPMADSYAFEQVVVANIDLVVAVFAAAKPAPKWNLLDRYLAAVEDNEMEALVCITKLDLAGGDGGVNPALCAAVGRYESIGYDVILTSSKSGEGIDSLRSLLQGKLSVMVGKSGVGKTSLLNALQPGLGQRVGQVSRVSGKGRHTTSHLEMFSLDFGGALVDTPGMREFGLWDVSPAELAWCFREMRPYLGQCKFGLNCAHDEEPGCAVRMAVLDGVISPERYQSYLRLRVDP